MLHIYRQVTGLKNFDTFVICKERLNEDKFPFDDIEISKKQRSNFIRRFWLKYIMKAPPLIYRGEHGSLGKILKRRDCDLLHIYFGHHGVHLLPFLPKWGGRATVSFHGMDVQPREGQPGYLDSLKQLLQELPLVMARSESLKERLIELGCPEQNIRINRTGIPMDSFPYEERPIPEDGSWHIVQACRLIEKKGLDLTLKAFADFKKEFPKAKLTIAGEGPLMKKVQTQATELNLGDSIQFPGFLGVEELSSLYRSAHFFMHPSRLTSDQNQEGIPNSMLEAMATGLPVVATLHGGIPEAVQQGVTGLLSPENQWEPLRDALVDLARDENRWRSMSKAAAKDMRENFTQEAQIEKLEGFYREMLAFPKPGVTDY